LIPLEVLRCIKVNITGVLWFDGALMDVAGGIGIVEVYHW